MPTVPLRRDTILKLLFFLPGERRRRAELWLRGREELRRLAAADAAVVSWGKSGRTWLRVMLSHVYQLRFELPQGLLLEFDNLHALDPRVPRILFTHGSYIERHTGDRRPFHGKRTLLLVRDPRDVAVSQYFSWKYRMRPHQMVLNGYPPQGSDISLFDFVLSPRFGMPRIVNFLRTWAGEAEWIEKLHVTRYEDLRDRPEEELSSTLAFLGGEGAHEHVAEAVRRASFVNMRRMEQQKLYADHGRRLKPGDPDNPDSFKVRRGKVAGYRDYFDAGQLAELDAHVSAHCPPEFGYGAQGAPSRRFSPRIR